MFLRMRLLIVASGIPGYRSNSAASVSGVYDRYDIAVIYDPAEILHHVGS